MALQKKRLKLFAWGAVVVLLVFGLWVSGAIRRTIRLSAPEIQSKIAAKFPIEKSGLLLSARFTDPSVAISSNANQIALGVTATVSILGVKTASGQVRGEGEVRYDAATGELFLDSPKVDIEDLKLKGLAEKYQKPARELLENALREYVVRNPIYRLQDKDTKLLLIRRTLKSIRAENGELLIELGL
jgi:hypothetical protein